jgi:hypothetical protein
MTSKATRLIYGSSMKYQRRIALRAGIAQYRLVFETARDPCESPVDPKPRFSLSETLRAELLAMTSSQTMIDTELQDPRRLGIAQTFVQHSLVFAQRRLTKSARGLTSRFRCKFEHRLIGEMVNITIPNRSFVKYVSTVRMVRQSVG